MGVSVPGWGSPGRRLAGRRLPALLLLVLGALVLAPFAAPAATGGVLAGRVEGIITPVLADHIADGIAQAERDAKEAFVIELDTPGGLDTSMREIVQSFLGANVPVVVWVAPAGARAASAGAIISLAAHVVAMAPGTAIGAATPVDLQGGDISRKIVNDAAAYAESVARARDRDVDFAVAAVREGRSITVGEAVRLGVADLQAASLSDVLAAIDGRSVSLPSGTATLETAGAAVERYELRGFRRILQWLADPNIAFLFLSLGTLGILYELANPGVGAAGIAGAIMIILAMFALSVLPVNAAGLILLILAGGLFIAEVFTPGVGVFAAGGTVSLILGGVFLFRGSLGVSAGVLWPIAAFAGGFAAFVGRAALRTRQAPAVTGLESLAGQHGVVGLSDGGAAQVFVNGAWWNAVTRGTALADGQRVRVVGSSGLDLIVEPEEGSP